MQRTRSPLTSEQLRKRLAAIGYSQMGFARYAGLSARHIRRIVSGETVPAFIHRLLLCEEALFALKRLSQTDAERVGKRAMLRIIEAMQEPIRAVPPAKRRGKSYPKRRNLLSKRFLPTPSIDLQIDEVDRPETWTVLASRIGQDEAQKLHQRLMARRPRSLGRPSGEAEAPIARTTDPI